MLLVETFQGLMPDNGQGRWCTREGTDPDLPPIYSTCSSGQPDADHLALYNATRANFLKTCSGFAAHQDYAFFEATGIDPTRTVTLIALRHPVRSSAAIPLPGRLGDGARTSCVMRCSC